MQNPVLEIPGLKILDHVGACISQTLQLARQSQKVLIFLDLHAKKLIFAKVMYFVDVHAASHWHCKEIVIIINIIIRVGMGESWPLVVVRGVKLGRDYTKMLTKCFLQFQNVKIPISACRLNTKLPQCGTRIKCMGHLC